MRKKRRSIYVLPTYFFIYDSLPATCPPLPEVPAHKLNAVSGVGRRVASTQARRAGQNHFIFHRKENSLWLNPVHLIGNFQIDRKESERILKGCEEN